MVNTLKHRQQFETLSKGINLGLLGWFQEINRVTCPCCGYPTLQSRQQFEICYLCDWEDDGQDDHDAELILGGPNDEYSLALARSNFTHRASMYLANDERFDNDLCCGAIKQLKISLREQFEQMLVAKPRQLPRLWRGAIRIEQEMEKQLLQNATPHVV